MKSLVKKILLAVCVASTAVIMTASAAVLADNDTFRSGPGESAAVTGTVETSGDSSAGEQAAVDTTTTTNNVTTRTAESAQTSNKKYFTKLGGFFWFLLSVIVNFILSFWIGNRFYNMARRSAQGSNEIRALRKDIEEKFASTITGIDEPAIEVVNRNESYARTDEGIGMPNRKARVELNEEEEEMMRRWDERRNEAKASSSQNRDYDDDFYGEQEERVSAKRSYQPTRRSSGIEFDDDEYEDDEFDGERPARYQSGRKSNKKTISKATDKAKSLLSNIFPFDE